MSHLSIYLAGNIQKGHEKESAIFWTEEDRKILQQGLSPVQVSFLNPAFRSDDLSDQKSVFGRDMTQVFSSDITFVNARERRGLGVGAEMMWAKANHVPVLILAPSKSHYRKEKVHLLGIEVNDWVHPFVESLADQIVHDLDEAVLWIRKFIEGKVKIKDLSFVHDAMKYYIENQFEKDVPMKSLAETDKTLSERFEKLKRIPR